MLKYVECDISYSVNVKQVIVSYSTDGDCEVLKLFIPKHSTQTVMLPVHFRVCSTPSRSEKSPMRVNDCSQWVDGGPKIGRIMGGSSFSPILSRMYRCIAAVRCVAPALQGVMPRSFTKVINSSRDGKKRELKGSSQAVTLVFLGVASER